MMDRRMRTAARRGAGFTLLEMLVVLVLVGLVSGIVFEALHQVFLLQSRFGTVLNDAREGAMLADWFRASVEALLPDHPDGKHRFAGGATRMAGLTAQPVSADFGAASEFSWEIVRTPEGGSVLRYAAAGARQEVLSWSGSAGRFVYLDANGGEHDTWPPAMKDAPQLPNAVRLEAERQGEPFYIVATPKSPPAPWPRQRDITGGSR
jgi:general secretion pathway protein J